MILKTLNIFDFLQFVDESYENSEGECRRLVECFFQQRYDSAPKNMPGFLPFVQLPTTLPILMITVCFAATIKQEEWCKTGLSIKTEYNVKYYQDTQDQPSETTLENLIRTIRNATAHLPDFIADDGHAPPNVSFEPGVVTFRSKRPESRVEFADAEGFIAFLSDYLQAIRQLVGEKLI